MQTSQTMTALHNINYKVSKIFNNPSINFFIIMNLILVISCYTFINASIKTTISSIISNPIIILFTLILVIIVGYYNINIAVLILLLLFVILFGSSIYNKPNTSNNNNAIDGVEGFTDDTNDTYDDDDDDDDDNQETRNAKILKSEKKFKKKTKEYKLKSREDSINNFKDVILSTFKSIPKVANNEYQKGLLENKELLLENEKKNNRKKANSKSSHGKTNSKSSHGKANSKSSHGKEDFQTIKMREFDPSNEEDTNFLITKEVLQDMINRIDYNFESNEYLKKYLKHRIEEIVEVNQLIDEFED